MNAFLKTPKTPALLLTLALAVVAAVALPVHAAGAATSPDKAAIEKMDRRFAPVDVVADVSKLPPSEKQALAHIIRAAMLMDGLFLSQVDAANPSLLLSLAADESPLGRARLNYFLRNKGPWSRIDHDAPFVPGVAAKTPQAAFYPADSTKEEVEKWLASLPAGQQARAKGFFTTIRRNAAGHLISIPYSVEYQSTLERVAIYLRAAAASTTQPTLKKYLSTRADALLSNEYFESDMAWMELDASIEPTVGPYETYEDGWFGFKSAFEAFITVRDDEETKKLSDLGSHLQAIEDALPIDAAQKNPKLGAYSPIRVVNQVYASGDASRGVATAAFNLPNDERVIKEKGSKRVMLKNVQEAKFKMALQPISKVVLSKADQKAVAFDSFFTHILMHELMHGLGPHNITVDGKKTTPREQLKDIYGALEEAKADISGLFAMHFLVDAKVLPASMAATMYTTFLASSFRTIRFGIAEAHGRGQAMQLNYLLDKGAFTVSKKGTFAVDKAKIRDGVKDLTAEIMTIEATGDYARGKALLDKYAVIRPETQKLLDKLLKVPVDIAPRFPTADKLLAEFPEQQ